MDIEAFVEEYPTLYHMAEDGSWPSIKTIGLLSTSALLDYCKVTPSRREEIESNWRPGMCYIPCKEMGEIAIRDQIPMNPVDLEKCLIKPMTPRKWYELINGKVFFWASKNLLASLLSAKHYKDSTHTVIEVDTEKLVKKYHDLIKLSSINSGSTYYDFNKYSHSPLRDESTFKVIERFDSRWVKEVTVEGKIPDISSLVKSVDRCFGHRVNYTDPPTIKYQEHLWPPS